MLSQEEHKKLVRNLQILPEFPIIILWVPEQSAYLQNEQMFWRWIGAELDYLQQLRNGLIPENPIDYISEPVLKQKVEAYGHFIFWLLQILIDGFADIQRAATAQGKTFPFQNPRELLLQICKDSASVAVAQATSRDIGVGENLGSIRDTQMIMGRIYRGNLPQSEMEENLRILRKSTSWGGFAIAAILSGAGARYLKKSTTIQGTNWKHFQQAHKSLQQFLKRSDLTTLKWNAGNPVLSQSSKPAVFDSLNLS